MTATNMVSLGARLLHTVPFNSLLSLIGTSCACQQPPHLLTLVVKYYFNKWGPFQKKYIPKNQS